MADTLDLLTLAEAKLALNITDSSQDTELAGFITAVSRRIDALTGPVVVRTITDELHNGGTTRIWPRRWPVSSITTVKEYLNTTLTTLTAETNSLKTSTNYVFDSALGVIYRRSGGTDAVFSGGRGNILITYVAGRYADTASVDPRFKQAAAIFLSHLWRFEQGQGSTTFGGFPEGLGIPSFGTPNAVMDLLMDELLPPMVA